MKTKRIYVADFETSTEQWLERDDGVARVWLYDVCEVETLQHVSTGTSIDDFMKWCSNVKYGRTKEVYFHNLKFDGQYLISWLLSNGYTWQSTSKDIPEHGFSTLISNMGIYYSIDVCLKRTKTTRTLVRFLDSTKKFPQSVRVLAKAYNLPILKGDIDYETYRERGYTPTQEELDYIYNDTEIVARCLQYKFDAGLKKMTRASDAMSDYINILGGKGIFREIYPTLTKEADDNIRKCYRGGYVYCEPTYTNLMLNDVTSFDVNSLYPSVMRYEALPYGVPVEFMGEYVKDDRYPLYIQFMSCNFDIKDGKLPTMQLKNTGRFMETEYIRSTNGEAVFLALTSVDLDVFFTQYNVYDIEYIGGYKFKALHGLFDEYIDKWIKVKIENNGNPPLRQNAKDMLNSLYGKFAKRVDNESKRPYLNEDGVVSNENFVDDDSEPIYTALACFVTAYARRKTQMTAQHFHDEHRFIYSDTDSVHILGNQPEWLDVDDTRLGAWKNEGTAEQARFLRAKTYIKLKHGKYVVTCAGMPDNIKSISTFDNFKYGAVFGQKLVQRTVKGGCVLCETEFSIKLNVDNRQMRDIINT